MFLLSGLASILSTGNIKSYPALCAKVTATFSVLSDAINAVKLSFLKKHERNDVSDVIGQLQKHESEKLRLTAALHLEQLRLKNFELGYCSDKTDERTIGLLKGSIHYLEKKIALSVESINETIEELRCIAADEEE